MDLFSYLQIIFDKEVYMDHAGSSDISQERNGHLNNTHPIWFGGSLLGEKRYICGFFNSANIIGGILQENPFFVPPEEFLQELRQRRASPSEQDLAK